MTETICNFQNFINFVDKLKKKYENNEVFNKMDILDTYTLMFELIDKHNSNGNIDVETVKKLVITDKFLQDDKQTINSEWQDTLNTINAWIDYFSVNGYDLSVFEKEFTSVLEEQSQTATLDTQQPATQETYSSQFN